MPGRLFVMFALLLAGLQLQARAVAVPCSQTAADDQWPLSSLDYLGIPFQGDDNQVRCIVGAENENAANAACSGRIVNPGNPQYHSSALTPEQEAAFREAETRSGVTRGLHTNPTGVYYCVPVIRQQGVNPRYGQLCRTSVVRERSRWESRNELQFEWRGRDDVNGQCYCGPNGTPSSRFRLCTSERDPDDPTPACAGGNISIPTSQEISASGLPATGSYCKCNMNSVLYESETAAAECQAAEVRHQAEQARAQAAAVAEVPPPPPAEVTEALRACVDSWKTNSLRCKEKAESARARCDQLDSINRPTVQAGSNAVAGVGQVVSQANMGSGAQNECFRASLVTNGSREAITNLQSSCDGEYGACSRECGSGKVQEFEAACRRLIEATNPLDQPHFDENQAVISSNFGEGTRICAGEAQQNRSAVEAAVSGLENSLTQSARCMCQLSSSGGNCDSLPTVATCTENPNAAGCAVYGAIGVCTPGDGYDAQLCNCQLNPRAEGCARPGIIAGGLSGFASGGGSTAAFAGAGSVNGLVPSSGGSGSGVDRGAGSAAEESSSDLAGGGGRGADGAQLAAGGGAVGRAAGAGTGAETAAAEGDEKTGLLGGLLGQAKTLMRKAFKGDGKSSGVLGGNGNADDMNRFRPRGLATDRRGIGKKNVDIWKVMNSCVQGETCRANQNNYITSP